jgi:hypothetical protein
MIFSKWGLALVGDCCFDIIAIFVCGRNAMLGMCILGDEEVRWVIGAVGDIVIPFTQNGQAAPMLGTTSDGDAATPPNPAR